MVDAVDVVCAAADCQWRIAASDAVTDVQGEYRIAGSSEYIPLEPEEGEDHIWIAPLDSQHYTIRGLEYHLALRTVTGNSFTYADPSSPNRIAIRGSLEAPSFEAERFRMISAPMIIDSCGRGYDLLRGLFGLPGSASWRMGRWNQEVEGYREITDANPEAFCSGHGYWLAFAKRPPAWELEGTSAFPDDAGTGMFGIELLRGWNMIGNPAAYDLTVDKSRMLIRDGEAEIPFGESGEIIDTVTYHYDPVASKGLDSDPYLLDQQVLPRWGGMWIWNDVARSLTLLLPPQEYSPGLKTEATAGLSPEIEWGLRIIGESYEEQQVVVVGLASDARSGRDRYDVGQPPAAPDQRLRIALYRHESPVDGSFSQALMQDVRPLQEDSTRWVLRVESPAGPVELAFEDLTASSGMDDPQGSELLMLRDENRGHTWDLLELKSLHLPRGGYDLRIVRGTSDDVPSTEDGRRITAGPNPFLHGIMIDSRLDADQRATIAIFDSSGRQVWLARKSGGGHHAILWDGFTPDGKTLPAGVYFLRVSIQDREGRSLHTKTDKIVKLN
jgi:hypothetical protein